MVIDPPPMAQEPPVMCEERREWSSTQANTSAGVAAMSADTE